MGWNSPRKRVVTVCHRWTSEGASSWIYVHVQKERHLRLTSVFKSFNICFSRGLNLCICMFMCVGLFLSLNHWIIIYNKADQTETEIKAWVHPGQIMFIHSTPRQLQRYEVCWSVLNTSLLHVRSRLCPLPTALAHVQLTCIVLLTRECYLLSEQI